MTDDPSQKGYGAPIGEKAGSSNEVRRVLKCEQLGNTYCLELDDDTLIFIDFSCG